MTAEQALNQAELVSFFLHDDHEDGPYGPGETARATKLANQVRERSGGSGAEPGLRPGDCELCTTYGREHDSHCTDI